MVSTDPPQHDRTADHRKRLPIVLLGLTGAGKTTVGHALANRLGRPFVDSDSFVAHRRGRTPAVIEHDEGREAVLVAELDALEHILGGTGSVVFAAGASVIRRLDPDSLDRAWSVWLEVDPERLADRLAHDQQRARITDSARDGLRRDHADHAERARSFVDLVVDASDPVPSLVDSIDEAWRAAVGVAPRGAPNAG